MKIGIIAEDDSDVAVMRHIMTRLVAPRKPSIKKFVGHGCGRINRKCGAWARNLVERGCAAIIVIQDLDRGNEAALRASLEKCLVHITTRPKLVLIPIRELEAWLMYDGAAIARAFRESKPPMLPGDPQAVTDAKKKLGQVVRHAYRKDYINTIHNVKIAEHVDVAKLSRASSFARLPKFAHAIP